MRKHAPSILHRLRIICINALLWAAIAFPVSASAADTPRRGVGLLPEISLPFGGVGKHTIRIGCPKLLWVEAANAYS